MTRFYIEITCQIKGKTPEQLDTLFEALTDALYDLDGIIDPDVGAHIPKGLFDFIMSVDADNESDALAAALNAVRCAVHETGGNTAGWEKHFEAIQHVVRPQPAMLI